MKAPTMAPGLVADSAQETILHLSARVATLERLLQTSTRPDPTGPLAGEDTGLGTFRDSVRSAFDATETCAVVSRGDDRLLLLGGRPGWHFPRTDDGSYAGYHPGDDEAAIAHLEYVRACGADGLVFPETQMWWFDHYRGFGAHLDRHYRRVIDESHCRAYSLTERKSVELDPIEQVEATLRRVEEDWGEVPSVLDLSGTGFGRRLKRGQPLHVPDQTGMLPFEEGTVDFVIAGRTDQVSLDEARRIAREAVCVIDNAVRAGDRPDREVTVEWRDVTSRRHPSVSVIIPTYNGVSYLRGCLKAIKETVPDHLDVEVIVADDCSTDNSVAFVEAWAAHDDRVRIETSVRNGGFIATCNRAAETATGDILLFLNNDTVPLDGWLTAMLRTFRQVPDAGVVGGKLVFPDGRLQEAGGVMFDDATGANFGKWDPKPSSALYSFLREVDYTSGALLATPRALFAELNGFDVRYRPAYYEDADYCFQVRAAGRPVLYQPESVIVHIEGGTSGTDLSAGPKRAQVRNRQVFADKWAEELRGRPLPPSQYDLTTWYELAYGQGALR